MQFIQRNRILTLMTIFIWWLIVSVLFFSCKKEESDPIPPVVKLFTPYNNQQFSFNDTIFIHAEIEHSSPIKKLSFLVTDDDEKPILPIQLITTNDTKFTLKSFLVIDNRYIHESQNFLNIKIEDEENVFNYWYEITIHPLEKRLDNLLVVTGSGNDNRLSVVSLQGSHQMLLDWDSEYLGGFYDSKNRSFYTSGSLIDGLMAYSLSDSKILWEVNTIPGNSLPHFTCLYATPGKVSAGIREGYIESYNADGIKLFKSTELTNGTFKRIIHYKNFIASVFKNYTSPINKLILFNYPAGNTYDSINLQGEIVDMIPKENMEIYIVMNDNGIIKLWTYNFDQKTLHFRDDISPGEAQFISGNHENLFLSDGSSVMWYRPASGSNIKYLELEDIRVISFDSLSNTLYVGKQDSLIQYSLPSTSPGYRLRLQNTVKDIDFIYNK